MSHSRPQEGCYKTTGNPMGTQARQGKNETQTGCHKGTCGYMNTLKARKIAELSSDFYKLKKKNTEHIGLHSFVIRMQEKLNNENL